VHDQWVILSGGMALGAAIACLVVFFLNRFDIFNVKVLGSAVSTIAGGFIAASLDSYKGYAWSGYGIGLCLLFLFFIVSGNLNVIAPVPGPSDDPRLKMLDELRIRFRNNVISYSEYKELKGTILAEIKSCPAKPLQSDGI
jgi:hypothetical protein